MRVKQMNNGYNGNLPSRKHESSLMQQAADEIAAIPHRDVLALKKTGEVKRKPGYRTNSLKNAIIEAGIHKMKFGNWRVK